MARAPTVACSSGLRSLGSDYRERIPAGRRALLRERVPLRELARPFALREPGVEWLRNLPYHDRHRRQRLDLYRPAGGCVGAPVLMQIHGGGWVMGNKHEQALPLVYHLAARGWVVVTPNYGLSPRRASRITSWTASGRSPGCAGTSRTTAATRTSSP